MRYIYTIRYIRAAVRGLVHVRMGEKNLTHVTLVVIFFFNLYDVLNPYYVIIIYDPFYCRDPGLRKDLTVITLD